MNQALVAEFGVSVGDTVPVQMFGLDQGDAISQGVYVPEGPKYRLRVAGIVRLPSDIATGEAHGITNASGYGSSNTMLVSNEWYERHRREFLDFGVEHSISLRDGAAGTKAFTDALRARTPAGEDPPHVIPPSPISTGPLDSPVQLETTALLLLGIGLALAGGIATALIVRAEQRVHDGDTPTMRSLGCSVPQIAGAATVRTLPAAVGGSLIAVVIAVALSSALSDRYRSGSRARSGRAGQRRRARPRCARDGVPRARLRVRVRPAAPCP